MDVMQKIFQIWDRSMEKAPGKNGFHEIVVAGWGIRIALLMSSDKNSYFSRPFFGQTKPSATTADVLRLMGRSPRPEQS
jgi:hypothetical protein